MTDRSARSSNWFQILSNAAIIVGLGLVVYELNQSKRFVHAQLTNEHMTRLADRHLAMMGEDPREALVRAALHPSNLNEKDAVTLDALYSHVVNGWGVLRFTSETIGAENPWRNAVSNEARIYFSSDTGRRWLNAWAAKYAEEFGMAIFFELALEAVGDESVNHYRTTYELLLAKD